MATMELQQSVHFNILVIPKNGDNGVAAVALAPDCSRDGFASKDQEISHASVKKMCGDWPI
jgi:hypothetical protein